MTDVLRSVWLTNVCLCQLFFRGNWRPHLRLTVERKSSADDTAGLVHAVRQQGGSTLVYCNTRPDCYLVRDALEQAGESVAMYVGAAAMCPEDREAVQRSWTVCTRTVECGAVSIGTTILF